MVLVIVCGLPGTGKTTVAQDVADRLDAVLLRTDVVRKEVFDRVVYTEEQMDATYREMFSRAEKLLRRGKPVVLDATFRKKDSRKLAQDLAQKLDVKFGLLKVECSDEVVRERIEARQDDESDADFETYRQFQKEVEPFELDHVRIDNSGELQQTREQVTEFLSGKM